MHNVGVENERAELKKETDTKTEYLEKTNGTGREGRPQDESRIAGFNLFP